jgi:cytochrome c-type biogenesis protein CcmE
VRRHVSRVVGDVRRYWKFLVPAVAVLAVLVFLLVNLSNNLVFFNTPTDLVASTADPDERLRLGGQVAVGTVTRDASGLLLFQVTDGRVNVDVAHSGAPPDLFDEGRGVVLEGSWNGLRFSSDSMLVKHDEQYRVEDPAASVEES